MKEKIKNVTILEKTVRLENGKILKQVQDDMFVQDDMGWFRCGFGALAPDKNFSPFTSHFSQRSAFTSHFSRKLAFTLSEVLITLGIIGIVAALTIPVLLAKYQDMVFKNQRKKAFSEFQQAFQQAVLNDEFIVNGQVYNFRILQSKFKVIKSCDMARNEGCWVNTCFKDADTKKVNDQCIAVGSTEMNEEYDPSSSAYGGQANTAGFVDSSGRQWVIYKPEMCLWILGDVNGDKGPNIYWKDRFVIYTADKKGNGCNIKPELITAGTYNDFANHD